MRPQRFDDLIDAGAEMECPTCGKKARYFVKSYGDVGHCLDCEDERVKQRTRSLVGRAHVQEDDLNEAQTREIVRQELMGLKHFNFEDNCPTFNPSATTIFAGGFRHAGYTERVFGACKYINLSGTNNRMFNRTFDTLISHGGVSAFNNWYWDTFRVQCVINTSTIPDNPAGDVPAVGLHFGTPIIPPIGSNWPSQTFAGVQFYYNYLTQRFENLVYEGDTVTAPTVTVADINPTFEPDVNLIQFRVDFSANPSPVAKWYLNGNLAMTLSSTTFQNAISTLASNAIGPGYYMTNATTTNSGLPWTMFETGFHGFALYIPNGMIPSLIA